MTFVILWALLALFFLAGALVERYYLNDSENFKAYCHICGIISEGPNPDWVRSVLEFHGPCHERVKLTEWTSTSPDGGGWHSPGVGA